MQEQELYYPLTPRNLRRNLGNSQTLPSHMKHDLSEKRKWVIHHSTIFPKIVWPFANCTPVSHFAYLTCRNIPTKSQILLLKENGFNLSFLPSYPQQISSKSPDFLLKSFTAAIIRQMIIDFGHNYHKDKKRAVPFDPNYIMALPKKNIIHQLQLANITPGTSYPENLKLFTNYLNTIQCKEDILIRKDTKGNIYSHPVVPKLKNLSTIASFPLKPFRFFYPLPGRFPLRFLVKTSNGKSEGRTKIPSKSSRPERIPKLKSSHILFPDSYRFPRFTVPKYSETEILPNLRFGLSLAHFTLLESVPLDFLRLILKDNGINSSGPSRIIFSRIRQLQADLLPWTDPGNRLLLYTKDYISSLSFPNFALFLQGLSILNLENPCDPKFIPHRNKFEDYFLLAFHHYRQISLGLDSKTKLPPKPKLNQLSIQSEHSTFSSQYSCNVPTRLLLRSFQSLQEPPQSEFDFTSFIKPTPEIPGHKFAVIESNPTASLFHSIPPSKEKDFFPHTIDISSQYINMEKVIFGLFQPAFD